MRATWAGLLYPGATTAPHTTRPPLRLRAKESRSTTLRRGNAFMIHHRCRLAALLRRRSASRLFLPRPRHQPALRFFQVERGVGRVRLDRDARGRRHAQLALVCELRLTKPLKFR